MDKEKTEVKETRDKKEFKKHFKHHRKDDKRDELKKEHHHRKDEHSKHPFKGEHHKKEEPKKEEVIEEPVVEEKEIIVEEPKEEVEVRQYKYIAFVSFEGSKKMYTFGTDDETIDINDYVVVETIRGLELGRIVKENQVFGSINTELEIKPIVRKATEQDLKDVEENKEAAKKALVVCDEAIQKLGLEMRLIEAEYTLDRSKVIFVYVADDRVDFRELLKDLATKFKCRIELRQIGPRNKAKIVGGLGSCGMETCCSRFLNDFDVVSINMAKNQMLALNVSKLSGQCGKLMCCLKYEDSQYKEMREGLPKLNSQIEYRGSKYRVTSMNVLLKQAKIENKEDVQFLDFSELWPDIDWSKR